MIEKTVRIDCFHETRPELDVDTAVVAIDVIRATTTAVTAAVLGRRCFPVSSLEEARVVAKDLKNPILVGELGGNMPYGFDLQNSPSLVEELGEPERPIVLLSTSGTRLISEYQDHPGLYVACLRNYGSLIPYLADNHPRVALIGAGTRGEFREEDQLCAAWIAAGLLEYDYRPADEITARLIERWKYASPEAIRQGNSAAYLMRSGQERDLEFVLNHIDDVHNIYRYQKREIVEIAGIPVHLNGKNKAHG